MRMFSQQSASGRAWTTGWAVGAALLAASIPAFGQTTNWEYDYAAYSAPSSDLEVLFGTKVAELDAKASGYNFGTAMDPLRDLNVISQVFQADQATTIGTGVNGSTIELQPGDYTFTYTLDHTQLTAGAQRAPLKDFQLYRVVINEVFASPPINNPGPQMALDEVMGGGYNTAPEYAGLPLQSYPLGFTGEEKDLILLSDKYVTTEAEYSFDEANQFQPGTKIMFMMFCTSNVQPYQMGWNPVDGDTGEGANVTGGATLEGIPVIVPVVPEPASSLLFVLAAGLLCRRPRRFR